MFQQPKGRSRERFYHGKDIMMTLEWDADVISSAPNDSSSDNDSSSERKRKSVARN